MTVEQCDDYEAPEIASLKRKAIVDGILHFASYTTAIAAGLVAPNIVKSLDSSLKRLDKTMDAQARQREIMKTIYYMKSRGYLAGNYEHGLQLTPKARARLKKNNTLQRAITPSDTWDGVWRKVIYDIPEVQRSGRMAVASALRRIGCFQLQKSTWITPFACRDIVELITSEHDVDQYVTFFEAQYLDNQAPLIKRFARKYPQTTFAL